MVAERYLTHVGAAGRSRGGFSAKLHVIVDTKDRPIHVTPTSGQRQQMIAAPELFEHAAARCSSAIPAMARMNL